MEPEMKDGWYYMENRYYGQITDDGRGNQIIRSIEQEPVRPEILPDLPERANVLPNSKRCGAKDRDNALDFVTEMHAEGYITAEELEVRRAHILESATHKMLVRVTSDFPDTIDQWLARQAREEERRKAAAQPKPPAPPVQEDKPVPVYVWAGLGLGLAAVIGGGLSILYVSPLLTSLAVIAMGIALIFLVVTGDMAAYAAHLKKKSQGG